MGSTNRSQPDDRVPALPRIPEGDATTPDADEGQEGMNAGKLSGS
jgi:hypothetical protein